MGVMPTQPFPRPLSPPIHHLEEREKKGTRQMGSISPQLTPPNLLDPPHLLLKRVLMFELVKIETTTSRGYESPCVFIDMGLIFEFLKDLFLKIIGETI
jgi:hypothetical protein